MTTTAPDARRSAIASLLAPLALAAAAFVAGLPAGTPATAQTGNQSGNQTGSQSGAESGAAAGTRDPFMNAKGHDVPGLIVQSSERSVAETMDRLEAIATERGLTVMARVDHAANAESVDAELRPTELLIFGNPAAGTPLMACAQTAGIDLPMKALAWEDAEGAVWLAYNEPSVFIGERHGLGSDCAEALARVDDALAKLTDAALAAD